MTSNHSNTKKKRKKSESDSDLWTDHEFSFALIYFRGKTGGPLNCWKYVVVKWFIIILNRMVSTPPFGWQSQIPRFLFQRILF